MLKPTEKSLKLLEKISETVMTWHHHHHILFDIAETYPSDYLLNYAEIGCYAGASSCLMLQRPNTRVVAIDMGLLPIELVMQNVAKHNPHKNQFHYIQGNSHDPDILEALAKITGTIDILFIDGSHKYNDVISDFNLYQTFIPVGGYVIFDDYRDPEFPEVHEAVNHLFSITAGWQQIGTLDNVLGAKGSPTGNISGNCFVARRLQ